MKANTQPVLLWLATDYYYSYTLATMKVLIAAKVG